MTEFEKLVKAMREAQKAYFRSEYKTAGRQQTLIDSKVLEKRVDDWLHNAEEGSMF